MIMEMPSTSITGPHPAGRNVNPADPERRPRSLPGLLGGLPADGSALGLSAFRRSFAAPPPLRTIRAAPSSTPWRRPAHRPRRSGIPTAVKMRSVAAGRGPRVVVANGRRASR